jgi:hypothetical protein
MNTRFVLGSLAAVGLGFAAGVLWMGRQQKLSATTVSHGQTGSPAVAAKAEPTVRQTPARLVAAPTGATTEAVVTAPLKRSPEDLLNELARIQVTPGPGQARAQYRILSLLDRLAQEGQSALPAIRQFLASGRDVAYTPASSAGNRSRGNAGLLPPSLRFGLFDVVRQIGGAEAEQALAESLSATGRGVEFSYLAQLLEEIAPGKYCETVLAAARNLLAGGKLADLAERNNVYDVLRQFNDTSYVSTAQAQLVQADGKVDRSALRYLQQTLGEQSLALAAQTFQDQRVADPDSKESLGRLALTYVGASDQALQLYHAAALDPALKPDQRRNLVEDLNQDGLSNTRSPTPEDLKIIASRYALTQSYLQQDYVKNDKVLNAAFLEANKDLANMLQRAGMTPAPGTPVK